MLVSVKNLFSGWLKVSEYLKHLMAEAEILIEDSEAKSRAKRMTKNFLRKSIWLYYKRS